MLSLAAMSSTAYAMVGEVLEIEELALIRILRHLASCEKWKVQMEGSRMASLESHDFKHFSGRDRDDRC